MATKKLLWVIEVIDNGTVVKLKRGKETLVCKYFKSLNGLSKEWMEKVSRKYLEKK